MMKIIRYDGTCDVYVEFQDEYKSIVHCKYQNFKNGFVKNPFDKCVLGVGYIGLSNTREYKNKEKKSYRLWLGMLWRCYGKRRKESESYSDVFVCDEWHNYSEFEKWCDTHYWECGIERMTLDKDILIKGNREYSKDSCLIVPQFINSLFAGVDFDNKNCGTTLRKNRNTYRASCKNIYAGSSLIGYYKTKEEAHLGYIKGKRDIIKMVANDYKNRTPNFPTEVYDAMINY